MNPLVTKATDGSKASITFVPSMPTPLELTDANRLAPELLAVDLAAVYQWMPDGSFHTGVPRSFWKQFDTPMTARNWNTATKLRTILGG